MNAEFKKLFWSSAVVQILTTGPAFAFEKSGFFSTQRVWTLAELVDVNPMPVADHLANSESIVDNEGPFAPLLQAVERVEIKLTDMIASDGSSVENFLKGKLVKPTTNVAQTAPSAPNLARKSGVAVVEFGSKKSSVMGMSKELLSVIVSDDKARFSPPQITSEAAGSKFKIVFAYPKTWSSEQFRSNVRVFVRDNAIAEFNRELTELSLKTFGSTEAYFLINDKLFILPISIGPSDSASPFLKVPSELVSLDGFIASNSARSAAIGFPGNLPKANMTDPDSQDSVDDQGQVESATNGEVDESDELRGPITNDSNSGSQNQLLTHSLRAVGKDGRYKDVTIQIVDDRSDAKQNRFYPVPNADVGIVGIGRIGRTDARGIIVIQDAPRESDLVLSIQDEAGIIRPTLGLVDAKSGDAIQRLVAVRESYFDLLTRGAGVTQLSFKGSTCVSVYDLRQGAGFMADVSVQMDLESEGPYYFNQYGLVDGRRSTTGIDGRACFFNIEPGVSTVSVTYGGKVVASGVSEVAPGKHQEDELSIFGSGRVSLAIASITTSHEQLGSDGELTNSFRPVDFINLSLAGESEFFASIGSGLVGFDGDRNLLNGRALVFGQDGDFELTAYQLNEDNWSQTNILPLIPRGFVEDMAVYADVPFDPSLGSILAYQFAVPVGADVRFRAVSLADESREFDGWMYSQGMTAKALFFNLDPGAYALIVETADGHWLNYQKVSVYNETLSFVGNTSAISGLKSLSK